MIDFVITGCGRSGTMWVAEALTAAELPCAHEHFCSSWTDDYGDDQIWRDAPSGVGESSWQAAPFVGEMQAAGVPVVHLVRHPIEVASSLIANRMLLPVQVSEERWELKPWHQFLTTHIGDWVWRLHPHDRALQFWTDWNKLIEKPDLRWLQPVDMYDLDALSHRVARPIDVHKAAQVPRTVNSRRPVDRLLPQDFTSSVYDDAMDLWKSYF